MKTISFTLSMPNVGSWNGQWSGSARRHVITRSLKDTIAEKVLSKPSYYYNFGDGWGASVAVKHVTASEARVLRNLSDGFCGYEWMIDRIIDYGKILRDDQIEELTKQPKVNHDPITPSF